MKKTVILFLFATIMFSLYSQGQYVIRQENFYGSSGSNSQGGQSFVTDSSGVITQMDFYAYQPLGSITLKFFAGETCLGTPLSTDTFNVNTTGWISIPVKNGVYVCPGTYTLVLSNIMHIAMNANDVYPQGKMLMGSTFYSYDMVFRVYIARTPPINPGSNNTCNGGNTSFSVASSSNVSLTYQWQLSSNGGVIYTNMSNGGAYSGISSATMQITGASTGMNSYRYRCRLGTICGNTNSQSGLLTINTAPQITAQPVNDTVQPGGNAGFSILAGGTSPLSYQWQLSTDGGSVWVNQPNGSQYSGMTTPVMSIAGATYGISGYRYRCSISNICGNTNSAAAILTVSPYMIRQENNSGGWFGHFNMTGGSSFTADTGGNISQIDFYTYDSEGITVFNIFQGETVSGPLLYTDTINVSTSGWVSILLNPKLHICTGKYTFTLSELDHAAVHTADDYPGGMLYYGNSFVSGWDFVFRVYIEKDPLAFSPVFQSNPQNDTVCSGAASTFTALACGSALSYQWQLSTNGGGNWTNVGNGGIYIGMTSATMTISAATAGMSAYRYRCSISNICSSTISADAMLIVYLPVSITANPQNSIICSGTLTGFTVSANGTSPLSYQWQLSSNGGANWANQSNGGVYSGMNSASMQISGATAGMDNYRYRCHITNVCGATLGGVAILNVNSPPSFSGTWVMNTICAGQNTSFSVALSSGTAPVSYQWQISTNGGVSYSNQGNGGVYGGMTTTTMIVTGALAGMSYYRYHCFASDSCGTAVSSECIIEVNAPPVTVLPPANASCCTGATVNFSVTATGVNPKTYQWQLSANGGATWANQPDGGVYSQMTWSVMKITGATAGMNGYRFRCYIENICGNTISTEGQLTVNSPPLVVFQPSDSTICSGTDAIFGVTASGSAPLNYQWQLSSDGGNNWSDAADGVLYGGVTSPDIGITAATISLNAYQFRCQITNSCGTIYSLPAVLTVNPSPSLVLATYPAIPTVCPTFPVTITATGALTYSWLPATGLDVTSGPVVNATPLSNTTYTITASFPGCSETQSVSINILNCGNVWTGQIDSNWHQAGNWFTLTVPDLNTDVSVLPGKPHLPIITGHADCRELHLYNGGALTIRPKASLTATGNTTLEGQGGLIIKSDLTGTGSFIDNGTITGSGTAFIERYISANDWHYISSPISQAKAGIFQGQYLKKWIEPSYSWQSIVVPSTLLAPLKGFALKSSSSKNYIFRGHPNTGPLTCMLTRNTALTATKQGWNLIGNPYPSTINWDIPGGWNKVNVHNAIYIFNQNTNNYAAYVNGIGINGASACIAQGQGFYVICSSVSGSIDINNNARVHKDTTFFKSRAEPHMIRFEVSQEAMHDETVIALDPMATLSFDGALDAYKPDVPAQLQIWSGFEDEPEAAYSINTVNDLSIAGGIMLSVGVPGAGGYELTVSGFESMNQESALYLEDMKTDSVTELNENTHLFLNSEAGETLHFRLYSANPLLINEMTVTDQVMIAPNPCRGYFRLMKSTPFESDTQLTIYNVYGAIEYTTTLDNTTKIQIDASSLCNGIYFIRLGNAQVCGRLLIMK